MAGVLVGWLIQREIGTFLEESQQLHIYGRTDGLAVVMVTVAMVNSCQAPWQWPSSVE